MKNMCERVIRDEKERESATQHSHIAMPKDHADDPTSVVYIVCKFHIENITGCGMSGPLFALAIVVLSSLLAMFI